MFNHEELACVKDFAPHFDSYIKLQNWNRHSIYREELFQTIVIE